MWVPTVWVCCFLREGVIRSVVETGVQEHGQGSQGGDDDKQPQEEPVHHQSNELPISCHLKGIHTHTSTYSKHWVSSDVYVCTDTWTSLGHVWNTVCSGTGDRRDNKLFDRVCCAVSCVFLTVSSVSCFFSCSAMYVTAAIADFRLGGRIRQ